MERRTVFDGWLLPVLLVLPQLLLTGFFFLWPAGEAIWSSLIREDPFGLGSTFVGLENFSELFADPLYVEAIIRTVIFCAVVSLLSMSVALLLAVFADHHIAGRTIYRTLLIWPYAVAPPVVGVLWIFMLHPSLGILARGLRNIGIDWNPLLNGDQAALLIVLAAAWKQISYNFLFFLAGLQSIPRSVLEAAAIDGARPMRRFWTVTFPLLSPTIFFLLVVNIVYAFFDTFGIIDTMSLCSAAKATETLVYKVYSDGLLGGNLGGSAAQSVILMAIVILLTAVQFRFVERKVTY